MKKFLNVTVIPLFLFLFFFPIASIATHTHTAEDCPPGQHWDESMNMCMPD